MRNDYQPYFRQLSAKLRELGYVDVRESDLDAEFSLISGWTLIFECEKYGGPAFTLLIVPPVGLGNSEGYAIWILMRAFEKLDGKSYGKPTIDAQIDFLIQKSKQIFDNTSYYESEYARLDRLPP
ncbi:MAG: hypothetical protein ABI612_05485 [Betaproteobacteria bacterium]